MSKYFLLEVNDAFEGDEIVRDWKALFDWLQHSGLSVEAIYDAVVDFQKKEVQRGKESEKTEQFELPLE
jgi:hypothetical protein